MTHPVSTPMELLAPAGTVAAFEEALQEGVMVNWLATIKQSKDKSITSERMELDALGQAQPTG